MALTKKRKITRAQRSETARRAAATRVANRAATIAAGGPIYLTPWQHDRKNNIERSFTCFPSLPSEIREMIWLASCEPRIIRIRTSGSFGVVGKHARGHDMASTALLVCRESRRVFEPLYPLCFGSLFSPAKTRFNFKLDTVLFDSESGLERFLLILKSHECLNLQRMAIECFVSLYRYSAALALIKQLKELIVIFDVEDMAMKPNPVNPRFVKPMSGELNHNTPMQLYDAFPKWLQKNKKIPSKRIESLDTGSSYYNREPNPDCQGLKVVRKYAWCPPAWW